MYECNKETRFCSVEFSTYSENFIQNRELICHMKAPDKSVFKDGIFVISIKVPENYPFNSPTFKFLTPIYHPTYLVLIISL